MKLLSQTLVVIALALLSMIGYTATLMPASNFFPYGGATGGYGQIAVKAPADSAWTAASNASWLSVVSGSSGTGNGTVQFNVAANFTSAQRVGTLTVGGQIFTVTQAGPPPPPTIVPVVEYHNTVVDDYFITADVNEQAIVDTMWGWERTGLNFKAGGTAPVYRFGGNGNLGPFSHFYTLWTIEQSSLQTFYIPDAPSWSLEAPTPGNGFAIAMYMTQPGFDGSCPAGTVPVLRASLGGIHRFNPSAVALQEVLNRGWSNERVAFCAPADAGGGPTPTETVTGKIIDGYIEGAVVCLDLNANGRCDEGEPQTVSDAEGGYRLTIPTGSTAPLIAEIIAGQSRDTDLPGTTVDVSYRMASPSSAYSTNITPFTTLVHLSAEMNFPLAEDLVRNELGLPPRFAIAVDPAALPGSLTQAVARSVTVALKATAGTLDLSATGGLAKIVAALPSALTELPVLRINTKSGTPILSKEIFVDATFSLTNPAVSTQAVMLNGQIRGRGHATWGQPKNPYHVKFNDDDKFAQISDVLGMPKERHWQLLADYFDRSLMRNKLALSLGNSTVFSDGLKWTPAGQHIEMYLNDEYVGVYLLTESIRIDLNRLNIKEMNPDPTAKDVDGGYIVEVDFRLDCYNQEPINLQHFTPQGVPVCIDTPDETAINVNQIAYVRNLIDTAEQSIYGSNNLDKINAVSFVDWYLMNELFRNYDAAFHTSVYLWKDTDAAANPLDRLLNMGPIWDFDISAGNVGIDENWRSEGCWVSTTPSFITANWLTRLFDNQDFLDLTIARWKQKRVALDKFINSSIDTYSRRLQGPQQRNFAVWQTLGVYNWPSYYVFATYADEVAFLKRFLNERMVWLDKAYASPESFNALCK